VRRHGEEQKQEHHQDGETSSIKFKRYKVVPLTTVEGKYK
jgi:hypothetical protein